MIRQFILTAVVLCFGAANAAADYVMIVPQKPGGGTSVWASIVSRELEKYLGEPIRIRHIPGARDIPGFNKWHTELRADDKTIMVSHGGNAVAFLQEQVDYNYAEYDSVGMMNLNIIAALRADVDLESTPVRFAAGSGMVPEGLAMTLLACGPLPDVNAYIGCFNDNVAWVKAMSSADRRLAFIRGELTGTRENPAAFKKHVQPIIDEGNARLWFHHGILDPETNVHIDDQNYPGYQMEKLYLQRWNEAPAGPLYDAYRLVKSFRDGMQKALWVRKDNPNLPQLRDALAQLAASEESMAVIRERVGDYDWVIGEDGNAFRDFLMTFITEPALRSLVQFNTEAFGLASKYKPDLLQ
jgi:hypothetical protein